MRFFSQAGLDFGDGLHCLWFEVRQLREKLLIFLYK